MLFRTIVLIYKNKRKSTMNQAVKPKKPTLSRKEKEAAKQKAQPASAPVAPQR